MPGLRCRRRRFPSQLAAEVPDVEHDQVGADEQQHERLDHQRQVARELGRELAELDVARRRPVEQRPEQHRRQADADRGVAPEQRDGDPDEADLRGLDVERPEPVLPAEDVDRAAEAGEHARDRHREEVVARDADPAVARGVRVEADGAHLVPERRPVEDEPVDDERRDRDEEADVQPLQLGSPHQTGSRTLSTTSFEIGTDAFASFWSGPPSPNAYVPIQYAIQLSMIVVITSCAPTVALRKPAMPAHSAPASIASTIASSACGSPGRSTHTEPTHTDTIARRCTGPARRC